jgi:hypothetical protein
VLYCHPNHLSDQAIRVSQLKEEVAKHSAMNQGQFSSYTGAQTTLSGPGGPLPPLRMYRHEPSDLATKLTGDPKSVVVAMSSRWMKNRRDETDVGIDFSLRLLPGTQTDSKDVDRIQNRLNSLIASNRSTFDKSLQIGVHHVVNNYDEGRRPEALRRASKTACSVLRYMHKLAPTDFSERTTIEPTFTYLDGPELAAALSTPSSSNSLVLGDMDPIDDDPQLVLYLQNLRNVPAAEFCAIGWDGPYLQSPVTIYEASGRDSAEHEGWDELCRKVGFPTENASKTIKYLRAIRAQQHLAGGISRSAQYTSREGQFSNVSTPAPPYRPQTEYGLPQVLVTAHSNRPNLAYGAPPLSQGYQAIAAPRAIKARAIGGTASMRDRSRGLNRLHP